MVGFGQVICLPVSPRCEYVHSMCHAPFFFSLQLELTNINSRRSLCYIGQAKLCPSYRRVDPKTVGKRVPVYYVDGTVDRGDGRVPVDDQKTHENPTDAAIEAARKDKALEW